MACRPLLTDEERRLFFGIPDDPDGLAWQYTFTQSDQDLVVVRRGAANQLGFAVQLALLRHPEMGWREPVGVLVEWLAAQLGIPAAALRGLRGSAADDDRPCAQARHDARLATAQQRRPALHDRGGGAIRLEHGSGRAELLPASSQRWGPQRSFSRRRRSSSATPFAARARARKRAAASHRVEIPVQKVECRARHC
jgi:hypothetical protein